MFTEVQTKKIEFGKKVAKLSDKSPISGRFNGTISLSTTLPIGWTSVLA
jgi:hypothetical protein